VEQIFEQSLMTEAKLKGIPVEFNVKLSAEGDDAMEESAACAKGVGMLLYLASCMWPDLARAMSLLARFMAEKEQWHRVQKVPRCLRKTAHLGLMFGGCENLEVLTCSNQDFPDPDR
jgi:hypothetical protein